MLNVSVTSLTPVIKLQTENNSQSCRPALTTCPLSRSIYAGTYRNPSPLSLKHKISQADLPLSKQPFQIVHYYKEAYHIHRFQVSTTWKRLYIFSFAPCLHIVSGSILRLFFFNKTSLDHPISVSTKLYPQHLMSTSLKQYASGFPCPRLSSRWL